MIGDGVLAVFPIEEAASRPTSRVERSLRRRRRSMPCAGLVDNPAMVDEPPLEIVVALHIGTVHKHNENHRHKGGDPIDAISRQRL